MSSGAQRRTAKSATWTPRTLPADSDEQKAEKTKQIEVTSVDSEAHEYIAGLPDGGEVKISGNLVTTSAQQQGLRLPMSFLREMRSHCPS